MDYSGKDDDDRSLPMSKWMRRADRVDFDCASSPPSDGFFYATNTGRTTGLKHSASDNGCEVKTANEKNNIPNAKLSADDCGPTERSGFLKSFAPGNYSSTSEIPTGTGDTKNKLLKMNATELERWAKDNIRGEGAMGGMTTHSPHDTAPTPIDHLPQFQPRTGVVPSITKTDSSGGPVRLVDKFSSLTTPDVTPCSTPSITPVSSPHIPRRTGINPFFTGEHTTTNKKEDGNWLFRPNTIKDSNMMYEAKVEIQSGQGPPGGSKNIRYVPKPSKLRELNFFSPTSM